MGYRADYFKKYKARFGKYQCKRCRKWFPKEQIEIDHIIPKRKGGTDDISNLQALCIHCNRSKKANQSGFETAKSLAGSALNGNLGNALGSIAKQKVKDSLGIKYKR